MLTKEAFKDQQYIAIIKRYLRERGFCCDAYKPSYLQRRIQVRLRSFQLESFSDYLRLLRTDPDEYRKLMDALTINVTQFFRDSDVYEIMQKQLIPDLLSENRCRQTIRIWSAGCASGEEPYSIAILMREAMSSNKNDHNLSIIATDIDDIILKIAREGSYSPEKLEKIPRSLIQKYFILDQDYHIKQDLKTFIRFKKSDLLADNGIKFCDLILCRNVLIYFNREDQERIIQTFYEGLQTDGYLVLGKTEILPPGLSNIFSCIDRRTHIYKKS
ncbi:MAG: protein-glutamate O-methyltransferase CheR [Candidatus Bathyarchaeota archaeon]